jgi:hypothetical protein
LIKQTLPGDLLVAYSALTGFVMLFVAASILKFRQTL